MCLSAILKLMTTPRIRNNFRDSLNIHRVKNVSNTSYKSQRAVCFTSYTNVYAMSHDGYSSFSGS
jgi:hypothetical protein